MENEQNNGNGTEGTSLLSEQSATENPSSTGDLGGQREDIAQGTDENPGTGGETETGAGIESPAVEEASGLTQEEIAAVASAATEIKAEDDAPVSLADKLDFNKDDNVKRAEPEIKASDVLAEIGLSLKNPGGDHFKFYGEAAIEFQRQIIASKHKDIEALTVCKMTVPSLDAPKIHHTPYCGYPVTKGDVFTVLLSNGETIEAV